MCVSVWRPASRKSRSSVISRHAEFFYNRRDYVLRKSGIVEDNVSVGLPEDYHDLIKKIYNIIRAAGTAGIDYREIIQKLEVPKATAQKFEDYLLSHYIRKLATLGLLEIGSKTITKRANIRMASASIFSDFLPRKDSDLELLGSSS